MSESLVQKAKKWIKKTMAAMATALVSEKSESLPPQTGEQPYKDNPKKGLF